MSLIGKIPRRCVNLPRGTLRTLVQFISTGAVQEGPAIEAFQKRFGQWLGVPHVFGAFTGRSAFQLALEAMALEKGAEIIFPVFTFPVIPMVARMLGYKPVFCEADRETFNAGPEQIEARITDKTGAVVATHLFGQPCMIREIVDLCRPRSIRVLEDCAHACGARVNGQQVGTFGDIGVFSFAEGKNMPCFGGGAIATRNEEVAIRAQSILSGASVPAKKEVLKKAFSVWAKWLLTRPRVFGLTAYPALRLKLLLGQSLMDSPVGDALLGEFSGSNPRVVRFVNLQAAIGLLHLEQIDTFNAGARRNARLLTDGLEGAKGIRAPVIRSGDPIYVYYPLTVSPPVPENRDKFRGYLLRHGFDSKITDMSDCMELKAFQDTKDSRERENIRPEDSLLEICVYPIIPEKSIRRLARVIREWTPG
ncbi:MAG TPA: DegT/DnrJ/EryC1/StrS family aminotransferase [Thermodesulfobacteriota bacterium]|nr:DegT/DnrJ/EryC1/StrS family aminotransferase [Thermodesulfobacteriota bacterium]